MATLWHYLWTNQCKSTSKEIAEVLMFVKSKKDHILNYDDDANEKSKMKMRMTTLTPWGQIRRNFKNYIHSKWECGDDDDENENDKIEDK